MNQQTVAELERMQKDAIDRVTQTLNEDDTSGFDALARLGVEALRVLMRMEIRLAEIAEAGQSAPASIPQSPRQ